MFRTVKKLLDKALDMLESSKRDGERRTRAPKPRFD